MLHLELANSSAERYRTLKLKLFANVCF